MKVKRYVANTLPQAMEQIKIELGQDAMILQTQKIKVGGFFGFFGKDKVEVIAAIDSKLDKPLPKKTLIHQESNVNKQTESEPKHSNYHSSAQPQVSSSDTIMQEVKDIKKLMVQMMMNKSREEEGSSYSDEIKLIYKRLVSQEIEEELSNKLLTEVIQELGESFQKNDLYESLKRKIVLILSERGSNKEIRPDTRLIHVVGPTGVGKTTTIAKLAAESVLKYQKRIAFITADTFRIAAVDQLRTYADILNAPIEVVFSPQDTMKALDKLKDYDLIFMDTAGRNYLNDMYISELKHILLNDYKSETYLVLSLTQKYEDMLSILQRFSKVKIDKILFTKFDETISYGAILNITTKFPYLVSYITTGQNVPDDIEVFNEERIATAILGGEREDDQ